jgi:hypothetical protein
MQKCRVYPSDDLLIAVIRRLDLDSDARLGRKEFIDGILPMENFTKGSMMQFKKKIDASKVVRPKTAKPVVPKPSKLSNTLHGLDSSIQREHMK